MSDYEKAIDKWWGKYAQNVMFVPEAKQALIELVAEQSAKVLQEVKEELRMHTVPEGRDLITRSYLENTLDFKIAELSRRAK